MNDLRVKKISANFRFNQWKRKGRKVAKSAREARLQAKEKPESTGGIGNLDGVFHPTAKQLAFLDAISTTETGSLTIAKICKKAGITPKTFWNWRQIPGFEAWMQSLRLKNIKARMFIIDQTVLNLAQAGDAKAYRTMYEKLGELKRRSDDEVEDPLSKIIEDPRKVVELVEVIKRIQFRPALFKNQNEDNDGQRS